MTTIRKASEVETVTAFFSVANAAEELHGVWIPDVYWDFLVNKKLLESELQASKRRVIKAIGSRCDVELAADHGATPSPGNIIIVNKTYQHVKQVEQCHGLGSPKNGKGIKQRFFFRVETAETIKWEELPDLQREDRGELFQQYFEKYYQRITPAPSAEADLTIETRTEMEMPRPAADTRREEPETEATRPVAAPLRPPQVDTRGEQTTGPRTVTPVAGVPTHSAAIPVLFHPCNKDIRLMLTGIIDPRFLLHPNLFVQRQDVFDLLRRRIIAVGTELKREQQQRHYERYYGNKEGPPRAVELDSVKFPLLTKDYAIPHNIAAIRDLTQEIVAVSNTEPEVLDILKFGGKGFGRRLVPVTPTDKPDRIYYNAKSWLDGLLDSLTLDNAPIARKHVVLEVMKALGSLDKDATFEFARTKLRKFSPKMDPLTQKALTFEAGLSDAQLKTIRKYTISTIGYNVFQPLDNVKALNSDTFAARRIEFRDGHRQRLCHYRPLNEAFKWKLDQDLGRCESALSFSGVSNLNRIEECHIILGGDHGQGAFRMVATLLLFSKKGGVTILDLEDDMLCGHIECKKDTYAVLERTIAGPINDSLKACGEELVFMEHEGRRFVEWGASNAAKAIEAKAGAKMLHSVPVQLFMVGDLAYQVIAQGREGASSWWCAYCMWGKRDWSKYNPEKKVGTAWTLKKMDDMLCQVMDDMLCQAVHADKTGNKFKAYDKKGLTDKKPLFDAIPLENYIPPPLHCLDLFVNSAKDLLDAYIDHRIENRPAEVLTVRWEEADRKIDEVKAFKDLEEAKTILEAAQEMNDAGLIREAKEMHKEAEREYKAAKRLLGEAAAAARKVEKEKEHGAMSQQMRQQIDEILADAFHLLRSAYHGGDMEGNYCRKMIKEAEMVMSAIEKCLLQVPRNERAAGCDDDEIKKYCRGFTRLFQYMNVLSHYCYQPYGAIKDDEVGGIKELVDKMDRLWRKLSRNTPPKVHTWHHLAEALGRFRGLKYHNESKIEVAHQVGKRTALRFRSMAGSTARLIKSTTQFQSNLKDAKMKARQIEVQEERSRKLGTKTKQSRAVRAAATKKAKHGERQRIINLPEITDDFPSLLDLTVIDRKNIRGA